MSDENKLRLERDALVLELDPDRGTLTAARKDGAIVFGPLVARADFRRASGKAHDLASSVVGPWRGAAVEVATPLGVAPGFRAELDGIPGLPARLIWEAALIGGEDALLRVTLDNRDDHPFQVFELSPAAYRGADPGLTMGAGYLAWRWYRTGYQSWTPAGSIGVMDRDFSPRFFLPSRSGTNPRTPYSREPGEKASDWMAQVVEAKLGLSCLLGFITSADQAGRVEFEVKYDRFRRLEAIADNEGAVLEAGKPRSSEWCLLSLSRDPLGQQARYFERWGQAMQARHAAPLAGWCTWYFSFWNVSEKIVSDNLAKLADMKSELGLIQIDDGFEPWVGEWLDWNEKFPSPPGRLAARFRELGVKPGLWLAPFLVSRKSPLYRRHPDWVLRTKRGRPLVAFVHPQWKGRVIYALDITHPGVQRWLRETVMTLVHDCGFEFLKLDFVYAAALPAVRYDKTATGAAALRQGLAVIREAAGDTAYLLGCGCPLGPAVGIVDAMRVSQDVDVHWTIPLMDAVSGIPVGPGAKNCLRNNLARLLMNRRLWVNDPDCAVTREIRGGMNPHEIQSELTVIYLAGGLTLLSEDLTTLPADRREWFRLLLPPSGENAVAVDLLERDFPETLLLRKADSALVARCNWSDEERPLTLSLAKLGLSGPYHVFDFWSDHYLGVIESELDLGQVPAHGSKYLRLCRADERPRLLAIDLHLGMGEVGCEEKPEGRGLHVSVKLPGERRGKIWVAFPGHKPVCKSVAFKDEWEGLIEPGQS